MEISGIVSGEVASSSGVESLSAEPATSSIASQVNCSEYSTSSASGGSGADALASGDCAMNINDSGAHSLKAKEVGGKGNIQVEGQVNSHPDSSQVRKSPSTLYIEYKLLYIGKINMNYRKQPR